MLRPANVHMEDGGQRLFDAPSLHRAHHAIDVDEADHNCRSAPLVWGRLFRTLLCKEAPANVGVAPLDHELPQRYIAQTLYACCCSERQTQRVYSKLRGVVT